LGGEIGRVLAILRRAVIGVVMMQCGEGREKVSGGGVGKERWYCKELRKQEGQGVYGVSAEM